MTKNTNPLNSQGQFFIVFLSAGQFYPDPVRCFLQYLQKGETSSQILNLPKNLYKASEELIKGHNPIEPAPLLQLQDGSRHPINIHVTPEQNGWAMLTLELGGDDAARNLIGEGSDQAGIPWLMNLITAGARMMAADCAFVSLEEQANQTIRMRFENGKLHMDDLPIIFWTSSALSADMEAIAAKAWKAEQEWDGSVLIIPRPIPIRNHEHPIVKPDIGEISKNIGYALTILLRGDTEKVFDAIKLKDPEMLRRRMQNLLSSTELDPTVSELVEKAIEKVRTMPAGGTDNTSMLHVKPSPSLEIDKSSLFAAIRDAHERRQVLRWMIHDRYIANEYIITVLRTALEDPDWEVRVTAVLGAARLKAYTLRNRVNKVVLPRTSREGLDPTDRRILVALRQTAVALLDGQIPPEIGPSFPNSQESMQAHLMRCVAGLPVNFHERVFLFVLSLTQPVVPCFPEPQNLPHGIVRKTNCYQLGKTGIELVWIPPVEHWLGDELDNPVIINPIRKITPQAGFFISKRPITRDSFKKISPNIGSVREELENIDYFTCPLSEAQNFSIMLGNIEGLLITIPTADEWEMAARGNDGRRFPWGNGFEPEMDRLVSPWGCEDMVGMIGQWTNSMAKSGENIICGGKNQLRCSILRTASLNSANIGFRIVIEL